MKLFLDANVIFTAAYSDQGLSRGLFQLAAAGRCSICFGHLFGQVLQGVSILTPADAFEAVIG